MTRSADTSLLILENATLFAPDRVLEQAAVVVRNDRIAAVLPAGRRRPAGPRLDLHGAFLAPAFIDLHIHGALGRDTMEADLDAWNAISRHHAAGGTGAFALTTVACDWPSLQRVLDLARTRPVLDGARLLGIHVEGPFLSPARPGAHATAHLDTPTRLWASRLAAYRDVITQVTLAPELPGSLPLIRQLKRHSIVASIGHSDGSAADVTRAANAGATQATHLYNCMSSARKEGPFRVAGVVETVLTEPRLRAELIADGFHVAPELLKLAVTAKGTDGLILVTDATAGAGLPKGKTFRLGDIRAKVRTGHALTADGRALAGSTCRMIDTIRTMVRCADVSLAEAIRMATRNPARQLGLPKGHGEIRPGAPADLCVFDRQFRVRHLWIAGRPFL